MMQHPTCGTFDRPSDPISASDADTEASTAAAVVNKDENVLSIH